MDGVARLSDSVTGGPVSGGPQARDIVRVEPVQDCRGLAEEAERPQYFGAVLGIDGLPKW